MLEIYDNERAVSQYHPKATTQNFGNLTPSMLVILDKYIIF